MKIKPNSIFNLLVRISVKTNSKLSGLYGLSQSCHEKFKNRLLEDDSSFFGGVL